MTLAELTEDCEEAGHRRQFAIDHGTQHVQHDRGSSAAVRTYPAQHWHSHYHL